MLRGVLALSLVPLAACGPVPVDVAERQCAERARQAAAPFGNAQFGVSSDGRRVRPIARTEITLSTDFLVGRDPQAVYQACVRDRSGHPPTRPLVL
jgi:hypothetical protein